MIKAVIFDFDDTITNNRTLDYMSFRFLSEEHKLFVPTEKEILRMRRANFLAPEMIATAIFEKSKGISVLLNISDLLDERRKFLESDDASRWLVPRKGIVKIVKGLASTGCFLFVASIRKRKRPTLLCLSRLGIRDCFEQIFCGNKGNIYRKIIEDYHLQGKECLVIGDKIGDIIPANSLQMETAGVPDSYGHIPDCYTSLFSCMDLNWLIKYVKSNRRKSI